MEITGIYQIKSKVKPERIYIGSAINISRRWYKHKNDLSKNVHGNAKLQNHYNKYGPEDLLFSVLLGCDISDLIKHEQYFIDCLNPLFNCRKIAESNLGIKHQPHARVRKQYPAVSKEIRQKLSELKKKWWEEFNKDRQHYVFKKDIK